MQWNCRGYRPNYGDLVKILKEGEIVCACLQETMLGDKVPRAPQGYTVRGFSPTTQPLPGNGLAIMIHNSTAHTILPLNANLHAMACIVGITNTFTICNLYLNPNENPPIQDLNNLINQLPPPFLILGDINGRHPSVGWRPDQPAWSDCGEPFPQQRYHHTKHRIYDTLSRPNWNVFFISICSAATAQHFQWRVLGDLYGSDHYPIVMKHLRAEPVTREPQYIYKKS